MILAYAGTGNIDRVLDSFIDMKEKKFRPQVGDVCRVLTAYMDWCAAENKYPEVGGDFGDYYIVLIVIIFQKLSTE